MKKLRFRKGVCPWSERLCHKRCPVLSVDNFGNPYPGCALVRLKTEAEMLADVAALSGR